MRNQLMTSLVKLQNHPINSNRDIVSFAAFMSDVEMACHVVHETWALEASVDEQTYQAA